MCCNNNLRTLTPRQAPKIQLLNKAKENRIKRASHFLMPTVYYTYTNASIHVCIYAQVSATYSHGDSAYIFAKYTNIHMHTCACVCAFVCVAENQQR